MTDQSERREFVALAQSIRRISAMVDQRWWVRRILELVKIDLRQFVMHVATLSRAMVQTQAGLYFWETRSC
jgi:hypothetical protein